MLTKLIKYDSKSIFKGLIFFYILAIFFSLLTRIFLNIDNSLIMNIIGKICSGVTISMIFNIIINNIMRLWGKFRQNLYGDESYLTHTLPIDKKTIYLSKVMTSLVTMFTSVIIIAITLFIAYYSKENITILKNLLIPIAAAYNSTIVKFLVAFLFILFLELFNALQSGYTGIILGHKMNNAKIAYSVLFGFGAYMITQTIGLLLVFIIGIFNPDIMNLFITNNMISIEMIKSVVYASIIYYSISIVIMYIINLIIFKNGVNVE